ncbi:CaMKI, partial [Symbiodinium microadriaticum]
PFHHSNQAKLFAKIKKGAYQFHPKYWDNVSIEAKGFISQLLCLDVTARLTVDQALEHPW